MTHTRVPLAATPLASRAGTDRSRSTPPDQPAQERDGRWDVGVGIGVGIALGMAAFVLVGRPVMAHMSVKEMALDRGSTTLESPTARRSTP